MGLGVQIRPRLTSRIKRLMSKAAARTPLFGAGEPFAIPSVYSMRSKDFAAPFEGAELRQAIVRDAKSQPVT